MSKAAVRNLHFQEMRGDYSTRINANGDYKHLAKEPELYQGFLAQVQRIYEEIKRLESLPAMSDEEKRVYANHCRIYGDRQKLLREASRYAFEKVFVQVANTMLPAKFFLAIADEARAIWRQDGWGCNEIIDQHAARKSIRRSKITARWEKLNNLRRTKIIKTAESDYQI